MLNNHKGFAHASELLYTVLANNAVSTFTAVAQEALSNMSPRWAGWNPMTAIPQLIREDDDPNYKIQPKHPCIVFCPIDAQPSNYPMVSYTYEVYYTFACPKILGTTDNTILSCELAEEAFLELFKSAPELAGIGWNSGLDFTISPLQKDDAPVPLFARTLSFTLTLKIEED